VIGGFEKDGGGGGGGGGGAGGGGGSWIGGDTGGTGEDGGGVDGSWIGGGMKIQGSRMESEDEVTSLVDETGGRHMKDVDSAGEYVGCVEGL
jgi:hypothetical protein